jgi:hypothetical protein
VWRGFHGSTKRWRVTVAHRRAGKTVALVNEAIKGALTCTLPDPRFGYVAPYHNQAKSIAWDYVKRYCAPIPGVVFNEAELRADFPNGGRVRLFGADNPHALRGLYFDGVILDEFGDMDPAVWTEVLRPALSDRRGWAAFAGTPRGKNALYDLLQRAKTDPDWARWILKASETGILAASELTDARASMDEAAYAREYECDFDASVEGAYYAKEMAKADTDKRICRIPLEPTVWGSMTRRPSGSCRTWARSAGSSTTWKFPGRACRRSSSAWRPRTIATGATSCRTTPTPASWARAKAGWRRWRPSGFATSRLFPSRRSLTASTPCG